MRGHSGQLRGPPQPLPRPPHRRPLPQSPELPPTWRSGRPGEGAAVSLTLPGLGGGTAPLTFSPAPTPWPGFPTPLPSPNPGAQSPLFNTGCPARVDSWPRLGSPGFQTGVCPPTPHDTALLPPPGIAGPRRRGPGPSRFPRAGALVGNGKHASPGPGLTLSRQFTFSVGYTILPHRAQLGFMAPGKAGAGTPGLARALSPRSELAGGGRGCNYTGGGGGWSEGTGLRLRPPSPNKHSGEEGLHRGGDAPRAGARAARRAPREPGCCAEAGSGRGVGRGVRA